MTHLKFKNWYLWPKYSDLKLKMGQKALLGTHLKIKITTSLTVMTNLKIKTLIILWFSSGFSSKIGILGQKMSHLKFKNTLPP